MPSGALSGNRAMPEVRGSDEEGLNKSPIMLGLKVLSEMEVPMSDESIKAKVKFKEKAWRSHL